MTSREQDTQGSPQTVDEARDAVERSRERISSTLDAIEGRIVDKKHELKDRADVLRPVREQVLQRPFTAVAVAVAAGALLGSLGGGRDEEPRRRRSGRPTGEPVSAGDREELRRWRRTRRDRLRSLSHEPGGNGRHHGDDDGDSAFAGLKQQLIGAAASVLTAAVTSKVRDFTSGRPYRDGGRESRSSQAR
ncbi:MAG TPA: hypothetical protein VK936_07755 [Longimicrobiales bacterium]|nr:hypothetical protein [Longimicrobiales bacterium]